MTTNRKLNFGLIMVVYLLGIFMGALDTGIVTPARTVIQDSLGVGDKAGIWMITIYTLAYAASIPVMGKMADRMGRRTIYLISIFLFGAGSLLCGLSHGFESFPMLLASRAIQAIGGGGIMPVATAEFGTTFPEEKRGMALGMVGGVYGIANIFGASAGSAVMDIFGTERWEFIFYVNVPIAAFIVIAGIFALPNTREKSTQPIDGMGICLLVVMVLSIMYGLKNIDFFDFVGTITDPSVYWFLIIFAVLLPFFIIVERRAKDPVMNLRYFTNMRILMTLCVAVITGIVLMGVIFIPQFCENALKVSSGSGGYFVIILGICSGVGAMSSGHMTDKMGPKAVLSIGLIASIIGCLIVIFFSSQHPNMINVFASLIFIGLGIGYTMGAPLNYMMLWEVDEKESNSALATLSLVRSLGTVVAPAIMVGFIAHAGAGMSDNIMDVMPKEIHVPELPYAEELIDEMDDQDIEGMPDLADMETIKIEMGDSSGDSDMEIPDELLDEMQEANVTTITASVKHLATYFFDEKSPEIQKDINDGINKGINGINDGISEMDSTIADMNKARDGMQKGIDGMGTAISSQKAEKKKMEAQKSQMQKGLAGISSGISQAKSELNNLSSSLDSASKELAEEQSKPEEEQDKAKIEQLTGQIQGLNGQIAGKKGQISGMEGEQSKMQEAINGVSSGIKGISSGISQTTEKRQKLINQRAEMGTAISGIEEGRGEMMDTLDKMNALKEAIPGAFDKAEKDYIKAIDKRSEKIENTYQSSLNVGFRQVFLMTAIGSLVGLLLLALYRRKKDEA